jgi:hypothetical protein
MRPTSPTTLGQLQVVVWTNIGILGSGVRGQGSGVSDERMKAEG